MGCQKNCRTITRLTVAESAPRSEGSVEVEAASSSFWLRHSFCQNQQLERILNYCQLRLEGTNLSVDYLKVWPVFRFRSLFEVSQQLSLTFYI